MYGSSEMTSDEKTVENHTFYRSFARHVSQSPLRLKNEMNYGKVVY